MARVYSWDGIVPVIDASAFVHPEAVVIGDVIVGPGVYVGPCAGISAASSCTRDRTYRKPAWFIPFPARMSWSRNPAMSATARSCTAAISA